MNKKGNQSFLKRLALCAVSMTMLAGSVSCGNNSAQSRNPNQAAIGAKIAVICKNDTVEFWDDVRMGAQDACDELGMEMLYYCAKGDNDYASQVGYIKDAVSQGVKAIVVAPNGITELNDAFAEAEEAGISIVNINSKAEYDGVACLISSSDSDGGKIAADNAVEIMFTENMENGFDYRTATAQKVGIIGHTAATADDRISAFRTEFGTQLGYVIEDYKATLAESSSSESEESSGSYDSGAIVQRDASETAALIDAFIIEGERCSGREAAKEEAMKMLKANPEITVLYGTNTNTTLGICDAIKETESNKVLAVGFNSSEDELTYIRQGILKGTVIQNPYNMGYLSITQARSLINGSAVSPAIDTGVTFVSADNLNDSIIQLLLYPEKVA